jgi:hypothetical protein
MSQQATLINESGNKVVVDVGSEQAKGLFGQGYSLMGGAKPKPDASLPNPASNSLASAVSDYGKSQTGYYDANFKSPGASPTAVSDLSKLSVKLADGSTITGDKATEQQLQDAGYLSGTKAPGMGTDTTGLADAVEGKGFMDFSIQDPEKINAPTFEAEKARLAEVRDSRLQALDQQYAVNLATVQKQNKNVGNSLKARLIKLGVSPSDSSWSNAEAGQLERDQASERALYSEYMANKAKIESDSEEAITNIAMKEATMNFDAQVQNIQNKLTTQAQGINLFQIFSNRDQSEKDREQNAHQFLKNLEYNYATFDDNKQQAVAKNVLANAQTGMYNVSDPETLKMLSKLSLESPYLQGLVDVASAGLTDRLDKMAMDELQKESLRADIDYKKVSTKKLLAGNPNTGLNDAEKAFETDLKRSLAVLSEDKNKWGQEWNYLSSAYNIPPTELDQILRKDLFYPGDEEDKKGIGETIKSWFNK